MGIKLKAKNPSRRRLSTMQARYGKGVCPKVKAVVIHTGLEKYMWKVRERKVLRISLGVCASATSK